MPRVRAALLVAAAVVVAGRGVRAPAAFAGESVDPRNSADVYERNKTSMKEVFLHVVSDLRVRAATWPRSAGGPPAGSPPAGAAPGTSSAAGEASGPGGVLIVVVDPTTSLKAEMYEMREALLETVPLGPRGLKVGVLGAGAEWTAPGTAAEAGGALATLATVPLDGPKNLLEEVRKAAATMHAPASEPRSIVLVSKEGGDGEDDVEATREALVERGVAFYSVAREAAFERPWDVGKGPKESAEMGVSQRWSPVPRRGERAKGEQFYGGETAFGLVPCRWELRDAPLAQTEFDFPGGRFPVPAGFGYWPLASLSLSTGGRCFVYNFRAPGARSKDQDRHVTLYDLGFLNLYAPDLRPRAEVARALSADRRAVAIVRIWEHLADEEGPVVLDKATLERSGASLVPRPMLPVRSNTPFEIAYASMKDVEKAKELAKDRLHRVDQALAWWAEVAKNTVTTAEPGSDTQRRRVEADFDLLGAQLAKVRFHWGEIRAALDEVKPSMMDETHRVYLGARGLAAGWTMIRIGPPLPEPREDAFQDLLAQLKRLGTKYHLTPWALVAERGYTVTFTPHVYDMKPIVMPPTPSSPPPTAGRPAPPPPPERPGSGSGSSTTGGR